MIDNRNMLLAIVLSIAILMGFQMYFDATRPLPPPVPETTEGQAPQATPGQIPQPTQSADGAPSLPTTLEEGVPVPPGSAASTAGLARAEILARNDRIRIDTPRLNGSIALRGGRIDDLTLADYRESLRQESAEIILLSPRRTAGAYFAQFGWVASGVATPDQETVWTADRDTLSPSNPVTLSWKNDEGVVFKRVFEVDDNYMFTVTQRVENGTDKTAQLYDYGLISRSGTPETTGFYILHEGLLGVTDGTLSEIDYDEIQESNEIKQTATGGWIGITDKYWLAALVPDQNTKVTTRYKYRSDNGVDKYQVDYLGPRQDLVSGGSVESKHRFFAGAKEVLLLDGYSEQFGVDRFDLAIDFGWFYFLTKPIFYGLLWLNGHVGNIGVAILILTVLIKIAFFPLANKSYVSMSKMKKLQPKMLQLRERYGEDKVKLNQEMMALYKKEKVNPASGCLPILIQIPVFFALYKVLFVTIEMRHAPFFGWIQDLSAPDPTTLFNLFGLIPWTPPDFLMIGVWPLIMGITMYLQQKLNPQPTDPVQAKIFLFLPLMFTFLLAQFPAGLVVYWAWNNLLSIAQQWVIMRRMGIKAKEALQ